MASAQEIRRHLVTVRHAPTQAEGICVGDSDVPCTMAAPVVAEHVLERLGKLTFFRVWASPRQRCLEPARRIAEALRLPLQMDDRLREVCLGEWQGRSWNEIAASDGERYGAWLKNWLTQPPPGGELPAQLLARVEAWWNQLPAGDHLLVAHAGVIRALRVLLHGTSWSEAMSQAVPHLEMEHF